MPTIWLPNEVPVLVSSRDLPMLRQHTWWEHRSKHSGNSYAYTHVSVPSSGRRRRRKIYMHRLITNCPPGLVVDHKNRRTLDNRRPNLRLATSSFNNVNRDGDSLSGYRGVTREGRRWRARISIDGEDVHIGMYATAEEAAAAYDRMASQVYGEFAWLNFDERVEEEELVEEVPF